MRGFTFTPALIPASAVHCAAQEVQILSTSCMQHRPPQHRNIPVPLVLLVQLGRALRPPAPTKPRLSTAFSLVLSALGNSFPMGPTRQTSLCLGKMGSSLARFTLPCSNPDPGNITVIWLVSTYSSAPAATNDVEPSRRNFSCVSFDGLSILLDPNSTSLGRGSSTFAEHQLCQRAPVPCLGEQQKVTMRKASKALVRKGLLTGCPSA